MPENGRRNEWVMVMRTLRLIRGQIVMGGMEEIPMFTGQKDCLRNIEDEN